MNAILMNKLTFIVSSGRAKVIRNRVWMGSSHMSFGRMNTPASSIASTPTLTLSSVFESFSLMRSNNGAKSTTKKTPALAGTNL